MKSPCSLPVSCRIALSFAVAIGLLLVPRIASARQAPPAFDVISIKPTGPGGPPPGIAIPCSLRQGGVLRCAAITLQGLITYAFRLDDVPVPPSKIIGGADWTGETRFEVTATGADADRLTLEKQVRALLEDRFKLKTHIETRPLPVYALVLAREDKRLGPQLRESTTDCPSPPPDQPQVRPSGEKVCFGGIYRPGTIVAPNSTMSRFADLFTNLGLKLTDRRVIDHTGLAGKFDVELHWTSDAVGATPTGPGIAPAADGTSLFTAIQEQLGLKLVPRNEPMDVLVIDHVEMPTPN